MSSWVLLQIIFNLVIAAGLVVFWIRLKRPAKDDPRLSRGLQILQSKIAVLEDLADRSDRQVQQLTELLETKARHLNGKLIEADQKILKIEQAMDRSLEVAEIFQDKIPHHEIIERQNTIKYVKAARMAHEGVGIEAIVDELDLPREQVEFIAKVNRDQLMFDQDQLPEWAKRGLENKGFGQEDDSQRESLKKLGENFRLAQSQGFEEQQSDESTQAQDVTGEEISVPEESDISSAPKTESTPKIEKSFVTRPVVSPAKLRSSPFSLRTVKEGEEAIRPVKFRRIDLDP